MVTNKLVRVIGSGESGERFMFVALYQGVPKVAEVAYIDSYIHTHIYTSYTCTDIYIHTYIHIHIYTYTYSFTYIKEYLHIHIHTYIHTYIYVLFFNIKVDNQLLLSRAGAEGMTKTG